MRGLAVPWGQAFRARGQWRGEVVALRFSVFSAAFLVLYWCFFRGDFFRGDFFRGGNFDGASGPVASPRQRTSSCVQTGRNFFQRDNRGHKSPRQLAMHQPRTAASSRAEAGTSTLLLLHIMGMTQFEERCEEVLAKRLYIVKLPKASESWLVSTVHTIEIRGRE